RQMFNLFGSLYGIGVQTSTLYFRANGAVPADGFAWYKGGTHSDNLGDPGAGGTVLMSLRSSGLQVNGSVSGVGPYTDLSDPRFKTNITPLTHALDDVLHLRAVSYDWRQEEHPAKNFEHRRQVGFIAQEVKEVLPQVVSQDAEGYYSIAYSKLVPVLVEAIKE